MSNHKSITDAELAEMKEWLSQESGSLFGIPATVSTHDSWLARCIAEIDRLKKEAPKGELLKVVNSLRQAGYGES